MKFAVIGLLLGCSAFAFWLVQSELFCPEPLHIMEFPRVLSTLQRLRLSVPPAQTAPTASLSDGDDAPKPSIPIVSKTETLALIAAAAARHNVPAAFVTSIVAAESNFDCAALSPKGAVGLMQLMPETAQQFGADPAIPAQNIDAGTRYLRWLMDRYQKGRNSMQHVIAAYNAGPGMVDRYRGVPPFKETREYVTRVLGFLKQFTPARRSPRSRR
jgi:soluble lytic murein transglycosylase-like protein